MTTSSTTLAPSEATGTVTTGAVTVSGSGQGPAAIVPITHITSSRTLLLSKGTARLGNKYVRIEKEGR